MGNDASKKLENDIVIKWKKDQNQSPFVAREGQTVAVCKSDMYIFGGVVFMKDMHDEIGRDTETNDLLVYNVVTSKWYKEEPESGWPSQRSGACMASVDDCLFLFGGLNQHSGWMNDMFVFNTSTKKWRELKAPNCPSPRDKSLAISVGSQIYLFGGFGPVNEDEILPAGNPLPDDSEGDSSEYEDVADDEVQVMRGQNGANFTWSNQLFVFDTVKETWSLIKPCGTDLPSPRAAHCLEYIKDKAGNGWLVVFGGRDCESRQNDMWKYSLEENKWTCCQCYGCPPQPRSFHASAAVGSRLIIHGGRGVNNQHFDDFNIFDIDTNQWLQPAICDELPSPPSMGLHSMCFINDFIILFGGSSDLDPATGTCTTFYNELYRIRAEDVETGGALQCIEKEESGSMPDALNLKANQNIESSHKVLQ